MTYYRDKTGCKNHSSPILVEPGIRMVNMTFLDQYVLPVLLQHRSTTILANPIDKELCEHPADRTENNGNKEIDLSFRYKISPIRQHDLARYDLDHQTEHNPKITQPSNPLEELFNDA
ncbi:hypothetical protein D1872_288230 [compost metagenome]